MKEETTARFCGGWDGFRVVISVNGTIADLVKKILILAVAHTNNELNRTLES